MIYLKSKPKEIEHYIEQIKLLSMTKEEEINLSKIMALEALLADESIKELIAEDLKDESWIEETQILINTCYKRSAKSLVLNKHLLDCQNFLVFRYLEEKLLGVKQINVYFNSGIWIFNEIDLAGQEARWSVSKFMKNFEASKMPLIFQNFLKDDQLVITSSWLHQNRDIFFSKDIFEDINFIMKKTSVALN